MTFVILGIIATMLTGVMLLMAAARPEPRRVPIRVRDRDLRASHRDPYHTPR